MRGLILLLGIGAFFGGLLLLWTGSSYFADFRTENITGPGVDVHLQDKYPSEDGVIPLEVHARGGSRAGIRNISVIKNNQIIRQFSGEGVTWHGTISSGKSRGDDELIIEVPVKDVVDEEHEAVFALEVNYVCAMSSGSHYENDPKQDYVTIILPIHGKSSSSVAIFKDLMICVFYLGAWILFWHVVLRALEKHADSMDDFEKDAAYPALGFILTGGILGYWIFATRIAAIFNLSNGFFIFLVMLIWIGAPVLAAWPIRKRLKAKNFY